MSEALTATETTVTALARRYPWHANTIRLWLGAAGVPCRRTVITAGSGRSLSQVYWDAEAAERVLRGRLGAALAPEAPIRCTNRG